MTLRVLKFGGSSLADLPAIERVAARIQAAHQQGDALVIVCSAMGRTTDDLLGLAAQTAPDANGRELDMLVTAGERVAAALLSLRLGHIGVPAWSLTGSQSGIVTDNAHGQARIVAIRPHRVRAGLNEKRVVVVAGFQGVSEQGDVTSLARGGSDTTAVALAAALRADSCEIYSDVDGVYSADPRKIANAAHLPNIDVDSMQTLADGGAKVLAAEAVALAKRAGIRIEAGHAHKPGRSTTVAGTWEPAMGSLAAVASTPVRVMASRPAAAPDRQTDPVLWASPAMCIVRERTSSGSTPAAGDGGERKALLTVVTRPAVERWVTPLLEALKPLGGMQWLCADGSRALFLVDLADEAKAVALAHGCIAQAQTQAGRPSLSL